MVKFFLYLQKNKLLKQLRKLLKRLVNTYVNYRWLGGMLTNWGTISGSIKKMKKYDIDLNSENRGFTKKELLKMSVKKAKLRKVT